ncbi:MAG: CGNR zinc finger domain-containing protein, partial [Pseudomonadota bacterium]
EGPTCTLYFHDVSKNHKRRWCSMDICGNRAKAAAHRKARKAAKGV